jgi:hypothetical protein
VLQPLVEGNVGVEAKPFLEEAQAKHLPVVNIRRRSMPGNELAPVIDDTWVFECVVPGTYDKIFKVNRIVAGHGVSSIGRLPVYKFTITVGISIGYKNETWSNAFIIILVADE